MLVMMLKHNSNIAVRGDSDPGHRHDGRVIRTTVGHDSGRVYVDYVCRQCGDEWSEIRALTADAPARRGLPLFRRKPDRRKPA